MPVRIFYGMDLTELKRGAHAVVLKVDLPASVRERLRALGIFTGAKICLLKISWLKKTFLVQAGESRVALGRQAAAAIRVWKV